MSSAQTPRRVTGNANVANPTADSSASSPTWSAGAAVGQLRFSDGSRETALGVTIGTHAWGWFDVSVNPTYAWSESAPVLVGGAATRQVRRASGLTDLPVSIGASHELPGPWSPSIALSLGITLPTGDSATIGSGTSAIGASLSVGFEPSDNFSFDAAVGRSLSGAYNAALASSSTTSLSVSTQFKAEMGSVEHGLSLYLDGSSGLTKGSPTWAYSVGIGTTASGIAAATIAPFQRLRQAFGSGTVIKTRPRTRKP